MAEETQFPKVDGDIGYADDLNTLMTTVGQKISGNFPIVPFVLSGGNVTLPRGVVHRFKSFTQTGGSILHTGADGDPLILWVDGDITLNNFIMSGGNAPNSGTDNPSTGGVPNGGYHGGGAANGGIGYNGSNFDISSTTYFKGKGLGAASAGLGGSAIAYITTVGTDEEPNDISNILNLTPGGAGGGGNTGGGTSCNGGGGGASAGMLIMHAGGDVVLNGSLLFTGGKGSAGQNGAGGGGGGAGGVIVIHHVGSLTNTALINVSGGDPGSCEGSYANAGGGAGGSGPGSNGENGWDYGTPTINAAGGSGGLGLLLTFQ